jgi:hypothetical protein
LTAPSAAAPITPIVAPIAAAAPSIIDYDSGEEDDNAEPPEDNPEASEGENEGADAPAAAWIEVEIPDRPSRERRQTSTPVPLSDLRPIPGRRDTGPRQVDGCARPIDFFKLLFTPLILSTFVDATNAYAKGVGRAEWTDVTVVEFQTFLGLLLYFGVLQLPQRRMAWSKSMFYVPYPSAVMSGKRFDQILNNWHWVDTSPFTAAQKNVNNREDPFWTVTTFLSQLSMNFESHYLCPQQFDIDEQTIPWKGRHRCRCYNPKKPDKWHFKVYSLNCAATCYQIKFVMYTGRDEARPAGMAATVFPVWQLLRDPTFYHFKNYILYTDNWYTSIGLCDMLHNWGIHLVGTIKVNKLGLPKEGIFPKTGRGRRQRGDMKTMQRQDGCKCFLTAWQDTKPVHILHTIRTAKQTCMRIDKTATPIVRRALPQPTIIEEYNHGMRGTDGLDQLVSYYRNEQRTRKWQPRIFTHFLHIAVSNCHILYKSVMNVDDRSKPLFTLKDFTEQLVTELCVAPVRAPMAQCAPDATRKAKASRHLRAWLKDSSRLQGTHFPVKVDIGSSDRRKDCKVCSSKCMVECTDCGVALCIDTRNGTTCYSWFHSPDSDEPAAKRSRKNSPLA